MWAYYSCAFFVNETSYECTKRTQRETRAELTRAGQHQVPVRERTFSNPLANLNSAPQPARKVDLAHRLSRRHPGNPKEMAIIQPGVARNALPQVSQPQISQP